MPTAGNIIPIARAEFTIAPLRRFPPLREGNRTRVRFPLLAGGTLRRGSSTAVFVNSGSAMGIIHHLRQNLVNSLGFGAVVDTLLQVFTLPLFEQFGGARV